MEKKKKKQTNMTTTTITVATDIHDFVSNRISLPWDMVSSCFLNRKVA